MTSNYRTKALLLAVGGWLILAGSTAWAAEASLKDKIGELKGSDESARLTAIDQLGAQGEKAAEAVAPLAELLADKSAAVRAHAAKSLGEIGAPAKSAAPALVELLKDTDETVRRQAVKALVAIRPGPASHAAAVHEDHGRLRSGRANAHFARHLGSRRSRRAGLDQRAEERKSGLLGLHRAPRHGPDGQGRRSRADRDAEESAAGRSPRSDFGPGSDERCRLAGRSANCRRPWATNIRGRPRPSSSGNWARFPPTPRRKFARTSRATTKRFATVSLWALARVHPEDKELRRETTEQLVERLKDKDPFVRVAAARALAALPPAPEITLPILEKMLKDADADDRSIRLGCLGVHRPEGGAATDRTAEAEGNSRAGGLRAWARSVPARPRRSMPWRN